MRRTAPVGVLACALIGALTCAPALADGDDANFTLRNDVALDLLAAYSGYHDAPLNPEVFGTPPQSATHAAYASYEAKARYGSLLSGTLGAVAGADNTGADGPRNGGRLNFATVAVEDESRSAKLVLGKQTIKWSQDTAFHPLDLFGRYNLPRINIGLDLYDPYVNEGVLALRTLGHVDGLRWDAIVDDARHNAVRPARTQAALRVEGDIGRSVIGLIGEKSTGYAPRYGLSLSTAIDDAWLLYAEGLHYRDATLPELRMLAPPRAMGAATLPALWTYVAPPLSERQDWLIAVHHSLADGGLIELTLYRNGSGYASAEWQNWLGSVRAARAALTDPALAPLFPTPQANPSAGLLGASAPLVQFDYLRRHYLDLHADTLDRLPGIDLQFDVLQGLDDRSTTVQLSAGVNVGKYAVITVFAIGQSRPAGSENAVSPYSGTIGTSMRIAF